MSYIPDYRTKKNFARLGEDTQEFLLGYHQAIADIMCYLTGSVESFDDIENLDEDTVEHLVKEFTGEEESNIIDAILSVVGNAAWVNELEAWCGLMESDPSVPEDYEPEDLFGGPYVREENKRKNGEAMFADEDYGFGGDDDA